MTEDKQCFFCGERFALVQHHIVPQEIIKNDTTVTLCANCHYKIHQLLRPLVDIIIGQQIELKIKPQKEPDIVGFMQFPTRKSKMQTFFQVFNTVSGAERKPIRYELLVKMLEGGGFSTEEAKTFIDRANRNATIYEPRRGYYKRP